MSNSSSKFDTVAGSVCSSNDSSSFGQASQSSKIQNDSFTSILTKEEDQKAEFKSPLLFETPIDLLCKKLVGISQSLAQKNLLSKKMQEKELIGFSDLELTQAKQGSLCSSQASKNHSPLLGPISLHESLRAERKSLSLLQDMPEVSLVNQPKKLNIDPMIQRKTWIQLVIRAIEEDLAKAATKCGNNFCTRVQQVGKEIKSKRPIRGHKEWLCYICTKAYDKGQFCEFCDQIYLDVQNEAALDGKEWAQCEAFKNCHSWAHVDCLAKKFGTTREMVVVDSFKYKCGRCELKVRGKRRM